MAKETRIMIETNSLTVLRASGSLRAWCPRCAAEVEMVNFQNIGLVSNLDQSELQKWLNSPELHRSEASNDSPAVCLNSLLACLGDNTSPARGLAQVKEEMK